MDRDLTTNCPEIPKNYFGQAIFNLQLGGIALGGIKNPILKYFYHMYSTFMLFTFVYSYTVAEIIHMCELAHAEDLLFTISYTISHLIGCAKVTVLLVKGKSISNFLQSLEQRRFLPNIERGGREEFNLINQAMLKTTFQVRVWWAIIFVMLSNRMIWIAQNPTLNYDSEEYPNVTITMRQLPYATSYLISFDVQKSPFYELVFIHQCISTWIFGWYMGNADSITNGLMIHLTAQFKMVANAFTTIAEKYGNEKQTLKPHKIKVLSKNGIGHCVIELEQIQKYEGEILENFKRHLRACIQHHQDTLNLAENMEKTFHLMLLIQFLGSLIVYSSQLYQLSLLSVTSTAFISMSFFFFAMIFQLLMFCWNGNEMSIASEAVADAVYNTEWISADKQARNLILQAIMRAQKPVYITAGKFSTLSMATFATILRGSVSYFTVLLNVNEKTME